MKDLNLKNLRLKQKTEESSYNQVFSKKLIIINMASLILLYKYNKIYKILKYKIYYSLSMNKN